MIAAIAVMAVVLLIYKGASGNTTVQAEQLSPADFYNASTDWLQRAAPELVAALDAFFIAIDKAGGRAFISPAPGALGRTSGNKSSQHYTEPGRPFLAADVMVEGIPLTDAYEIARGLKLFSGVGVYPDWGPAPGLHLDVRPDRTPDNPATWAGMKLADGSQSTAFPVERGLIV